jgi:ribulose kinase
VGLGDLLAKGGLPEVSTQPGADLGRLSAAATGALGLGPRCRVAAGLVDAHAGALAVLGGRTARSKAHGHAALITGTSNSVMILAPDRCEVPDMWGPYFGAVMPEHWMTEGGQSASGALLDHMIGSHPAGGAATALLRMRIETRIGELLARDGPELAADLIVLPDFHGNRTPFGDPRGRGAIIGMTLDESFDGLCRLYWRTAVGVALGVRDVVEAFEQSGVPVATLYLAGGQAASSLLPKLTMNVSSAFIGLPSVSFH